MSTAAGEVHTAYVRLARWRRGEETELGALGIALGRLGPLRVLYATSKAGLSQPNPARLFPMFSAPESKGPVTQDGPRAM